MLIAMAGLAWGLNWAATRILLQSLPPLTIRTIAIALGALILFGAAIVNRDPLRIPQPERIKVGIAAFLNVIVFNVCSVYAQVFGSTSRAVIMAYTMPIWAVLLGRIILRDRLSHVKLIAVSFCAVGLGVLLIPSLHVGLSAAPLFALGSAWSWAAGTVYQKQAKLRVPLLVSTSWQLLISAMVLAAGMLAVDGIPKLSALPVTDVALLVYSGAIAMGVAYLGWFVALAKLRTATATIGTLLAPATGVAASILVNGERPSVSDEVGFALIFAAAATVLLEPTQVPRLQLTRGADLSRRDRVT
jgi:drug/metabolite transporter (DMT)-like permease